MKRLEPEIDFETANTAGLGALPDFKVLEVAAQKNRVLVSHDRRTMPGAFYAFIQKNQSPGLILLKQRCPFGQAIEGLRICYHTLELAEFANRIQYLPL